MYTPSEKELEVCRTGKGSCSFGICSECSEGCKMEDKDEEEQESN